MQLKSFENQRYENSNQTTEFRHRAALDLVSSGPVLDLGCGDGLFLDMLKKAKNISGVGLDVSEAAASKAKARGIDARVFDFTASRLPFENESFETVVLLDVLEHLYQPELLLKEIYRIAKRDVILSVPNFVSLKPRLQVLFGKVPENNRPGKGHIYWFTYKTLEHLLQRNGFKTVDFRYNSVLGNKFLLGYAMKFLVRIRPQIFALSFVLKAKKL